MLKVKRIENTLFAPDDGVNVRVKKTGNITELRTSLHESRQTIQKLNKNEYVVLDTGELKEFEHTNTRAENLISIKQSMQKLRDIINTNCTESDKCKFITLTYRENMQDTKQLYADVKKFHMRLRYYMGDTKFEYITAIEPQGRGAWHIHEILIFDKKAPFIHNSKLGEIWGHGFTKINNIDSVDNVGIYLTAYLCNLDVEQANLNDLKAAKTILETEKTDEQGNKVNKRFIKGGRLKYYPTGMRFYRCSRGVKRPEILNCPLYVAKNITKKSTLTYERTIELLDGENTVNIINYRQYNKKPRKDILKNG